MHRHSRARPVIVSIIVHPQNETSPTVEMSVATLLSVPYELVPFIFGGIGHVRGCPQNDDPTRRLLNFRSRLYKLTQQFRDRAFPPLAPRGFEPDDSILGALRMLLEEPGQISSVRLPSINVVAQCLPSVPESRKVGQKLLQGVTYYIQYKPDLFTAYQKSEHTVRMRVPPFKKLHHRDDVLQSSSLPALLVVSRKYTIQRASGDAQGQR